MHRPRAPRDFFGIATVVADQQISFGIKPQIGSASIAGEKVFPRFGRRREGGLKRPVLAARACPLVAATKTRATAQALANQSGAYKKRWQAWGHDAQGVVAQDECGARCETWHGPSAMACKA